MVCMKGKRELTRTVTVGVMSPIIRGRSKRLLG
jgi:hypothetical protein